jgi:hypothetical protein
LLELRERGGQKLLPNIRYSSKQLLFVYPYVALILGYLAFRGDWPDFKLVGSFALGYLVFQIQYFQARMLIWPFNEKAINWDIVKKISEDESSDPATKSTN